MIENLKNLDAFSESVQFNASKQCYKKRTLVGALLSIAIIFIALTYFIYLSYLFFSGKIDPKFQSQTFVSNEDIDVELSNELIGFDYFSNQNYSYLNQLQDKQNLTFMSFVGIYMFNNSTHTIKQKLDIIRCKSPQLKYMNCFDFSKLPQQVLTLGNMNRILSSINLYAYMCKDTDHIKLFVPNNCAEEKKIFELVNLSGFVLDVKLRTSQFNTTQQEIQYQYKSQLSISNTNMIQMADFKIQNQKTSVKQGFLIQSEQHFQSPISYVVQTTNYIRQQIIQSLGSKYLNYIYFEIDENITYFHIQYPMFTEVLALCNSTIALMLLLCSFCRQLARKIIRQDIFFILLQNIFSKTYMKLLSEDNQNKEIIQKQVQKNDQVKEIHQFQSDQQEEQLEDDLNKEEKMEAESKNDFSIPQFIPRFSQQLLNKMQSQKLDLTQTKENIEEVIKQTNLIIQPYSDEMEFKKQEINLTDMTHIKSFNLQSLSYQEQTPIQAKFDFCQTNSHLHSIDFREKLIQLTPQTHKHRKYNQRITSPNRSSFRQKESTSYPAVSNQLIDYNLQILNGKQLSQKFQQQIFQAKNYQQTKGLTQEVLKKMELKIDDSLDFFKFYKEILFLKKAVLVLLSKEQLAAIQLVGLDIDEIDPKSHKIIKEEQGIIVFMQFKIYFTNKNQVMMIII